MFSYCGVISSLSITNFSLHSLDFKSLEIAMGNWFNYCNPKGSIL